jgi:hypothetical protein
LHDIVEFGYQDIATMNGKLLDHMSGACFHWFHLWMGEGGPTLDGYEDEDNDARTVYKAASRVDMFEKRWHVISSALDRWTVADLEQLLVPPTSHLAWVRTDSRVRRRAPTYSPVDWLACHGA